MDNMKYIIVGDDYLRRVYIFSDNVQHADMARDVGATAPEQSNLNKANVIVAAGFVRIQSNRNKSECECWGRSVSLNLFSRPEDSDILNKEFGLNKDSG